MTDMSPRPIHEGMPEAGYYWMRREKNGRRYPVVIRKIADGSMVAFIGTDEPPRFVTKPADDIWTWVADKRVEKEACEQAMKTGAWPGDIAWPVLGDNLGPALDEEITEAIGLATQFLTSTPAIKTQAECDKAANLRTLMSQLKAKAEAAHKEEKAPHLEAGRLVDAKWKPIVASCEDTAKALRRVATAYLVEQDAARLAAETAARNAAAAVEEKTGARVEVIPGPKVQAGGQRGSRMGLKEVTVYNVDDYDAVLAYVKDRADVREAVEKAARTLMKAGVAVPGMSTSKVKEAT